MRAGTDHRLLLRGDLPTEHGLAGALKSQTQTETSHCFQGTTFSSRMSPSSCIRNANGWYVGPLMLLEQSTMNWMT